MAKTNFNLTDDRHVFYGRNVLQSIILLSVGEIGSVVVPDAKDVRFDVAGNEVTVEVAVSVRFGNSAFDAAYRVQENIRSSVETMTGYKVIKVDVLIKSVVTDET